MNWYFMQQHCFSKITAPGHNTQQVRYNGILWCRIMWDHMGLYFIINLHSHQQGFTSYAKCRSHLKILSAKRVSWSKFHTNVRCHHTKFSHLLSVICAPMGISICNFSGMLFQCQKSSSSVNKTEHVVSTWQSSTESFRNIWNHLRGWIGKGTPLFACKVTRSYMPFCSL